MEYDLGIYFEANGHGTVVFSDDLLKRLDGMTRLSLTVRRKAVACLAQLFVRLQLTLMACACHCGCKQPGATQAVKRLLAASRLINQAVGDALSDCLFVEAVLTLKGWSIQDWDNMYADLPSRQTKLAVKDRRVVVTVPDETRLTAPTELQDAIDALVAEVPSGRAFCR